MFPDCSPGATLEGHPVTGADGKIGILSAEDYEALLAELGETTVTGIGTCGPDDPDRRSYHVAFWAATEGGSLELVRRGRVVDRDRLRGRARELGDRLRRSRVRAGLRKRGALGLDRIR
jgi:hypothetical protein